MTKKAWTQDHYPEFTVFCGHAPHCISDIVFDCAEKLHRPWWWNGTLQRGKQAVLSGFWGVAFRRDRFLKRFFNASCV